MTELFAVFDAAAKRYIDPFCGPTVEFAIRGFKEACQRADHQFSKFPEDYALYHVGSFDPELGVITGMTARKIAAATSFVHGIRIDPEDVVASQQPGA